MSNEYTDRQGSVQRLVVKQETHVRTADVSFHTAFNPDSSQQNFPVSQQQIDVSPDARQQDPVSRFSLEDSESPPRSKTKQQLDGPQSVRQVIKISQKQIMDQKVSLLEQVEKILGERQQRKSIQVTQDPNDAHHHSAEQSTPLKGSCPAKAFREAHSFDDVNKQRFVPTVENYNDDFFERYKRRLYQTNVPRRLSVQQLQPQRQVSVQPSSQLLSNCSESRMKLRQRFELNVQNSDRTQNLPFLSEDSLSNKQIKQGVREIQFVHCKAKFKLPQTHMADTQSKSIQIVEQFQADCQKSDPQSVTPNRARLQQEYIEQNLRKLPGKQREPDLCDQLIQEFKNFDVIREDFEKLHKIGLYEDYNWKDYDEYGLVKFSRRPDMVYDIFQKDKPSYSHRPSCYFQSNNYPNKTQHTKLKRSTQSAAYLDRWLTGKFYNDKINHISSFKKRHSNSDNRPLPLEIKAKKKSVPNLSNSKHNSSTISARIPLIVNQSSMETLQHTETLETPKYSRKSSKLLPCFIKGQDTEGVSEQQLASIQTELAQKSATANETSHEELPDVSGVKKDAIWGDQFTVERPNSFYFTRQMTREHRKGQFAHKMRTNREFHAKKFGVTVNLTRDDHQMRKTVHAIENDFLVDHIHLMKKANMRVLITEPVTCQKYSKSPNQLQNDSTIIDTGNQCNQTELVVKDVQSNRNRWESPYSRVKERSASLKKMLFLNKNQLNLKVKIKNLDIDSAGQSNLNQTCTEDGLRNEEHLLLAESNNALVDANSIPAEKYLTSPERWFLEQQDLRQQQNLQNSLEISSKKIIARHIVSNSLDYESSISTKNLLGILHIPAHDSQAINSNTELLRPSVTRIQCSENFHRNSTDDDDYASSAQILDMPPISSTT